MNNTAVKIPGNCGCKKRIITIKKRRDTSHKYSYIFGTHSNIAVTGGCHFLILMSRPVSKRPGKSNGEQRAHTTNRDGGVNDGRRGSGVDHGRDKEGFSDSDESSASQQSPPGQKLRNGKRKGAPAKGKGPARVPKPRKHPRPARPHDDEVRRTNTYAARHWVVVLSGLSVAVYKFCFVFGDFEFISSYS